MYQLDIEKSKYLGGDVEYTHLVKGLDYALLERTRLEIAADNEAGIYYLCEPRVLVYFITS